MSNLKFSGGCACGAVRYEVSGKPGFSFFCHCDRCQKATGTGHAPGMKVERENLTYVGDLASYEVEADSGFAASHQFCPKCGSPVFSSTKRFPEGISVYVGSLDDPSIFDPTHVLCANSVQPWDHVDPDLI